MLNIRKAVGVLIVLIGLIAGAVLIYLGAYPSQPRIVNVTTPIATATAISGPADSQVKVFGVNGPSRPSENESAYQNSREMYITPDTMEPNRFFIPALKIYSYIDNSNDFGTWTASHELVLPPAYEVTKALDGADFSDSEGTVVLAGHNHWGTYDGALATLGAIKAGNLAYVKDSSGKLYKFMLTKLDEYKKDSNGGAGLPQDIFKNKVGPKHLVVITCGGKLFSEGREEYGYDSNIVAVFTPVE